MGLEQMDQHLAEVALDRIELRETHVLDLLDDMFSIDLVHPLAARDTAQQAGLMFRPSKGVAVIEIVSHGWTVARTRHLRHARQGPLDPVEAAASCSSSTRQSWLSS